MLLPFFEWCDTTALGGFIRGNTWAFPLTETFHIWALAVMLGGLFIIDLALMGFHWGSFNAARLNRELKRYINWSMAIILLSGTLLFLSDALKAYNNDAFWPKMYLLAAAIVWHFTGHKKALEQETTPGWGKLAGALSLFLWFGVGAAGRAIGFV